MLTLACALSACRTTAPLVLEPHPISRAAVPNVWLERSREDLRTARLRAALERRYVLVDLVSDCNHCRALDAEMWNDEAVREWAAWNCVVLHVDGLRSEDVASVLRVTDLPTNLLLRSDGSELLRISGSRTPGEFHAALRSHARLGEPSGMFERALASTMERTEARDVRIRVTAADTGVALDHCRVRWIGPVDAGPGPYTSSGLVSLDECSGTYDFTSPWPEIDLTIESQDCRFETFLQHVELNAGPTALDIRLPRATGIRLEIRDPRASLPVMRSNRRLQWSIVAIDALGNEFQPHWEDESAHFDLPNAGEYRIRFDRVPIGYSPPLDHTVEVALHDMTAFRIDLARNP